MTVTPSDIKRVLIIQTAFIGDVILTTPLVRVIRDNIPETQIDFLTIPASHSIIETNPMLNEVIIFDKKGSEKGLWGLLKNGRQLEKRNYDLCLTPHRSLRSAYLTKKTAAAIRIGFNKSAWKGAYTHIVEYKSELHEIERNLSLLSPIGLESAILTPEIFYTDQDESQVEMLLNRFEIKHESLFAVAPGSVWPTKRWPVTYYTELCQMMEDAGWQVVLIGGKNDIVLCQTIARQCSHSYITAGELTLRESYCLLTKCAGILTNDSAPLHMGIAAAIPVIAIFGATVPAFGFAPFGELSVVIEVNDLYCRPCGIHGGQKCPTRTFDCMININPEDVMKKILALVRQD
jgi:heptosyltransferase-2